MAFLAARAMYNFQPITSQRMMATASTKTQGGLVESKPRLKVNARKRDDRSGNQNWVPVGNHYIDLNRVKAIRVSSYDYGWGKFNHTKLDFILKDSNGDCVDPHNSEKREVFSHVFASYQEATDFLTKNGIKKSE